MKPVNKILSSGSVVISTVLIIILGFIGLYFFNQADELQSQTTELEESIEELKSQNTSIISHLEGELYDARFHIENMSEDVEYLVQRKEELRTDIRNLEALIEYLSDEEIPVSTIQEFIDAEGIDTEEVIEIVEDEDFSTEDLEENGEEESIEEYLEDEIEDN